MQHRNVWGTLLRKPPLALPIGLAMALGCAKGVEIGPGEIVILAESPGDAGAADAASDSDGGSGSSAAGAGATPAAAAPAPGTPEASLLPGIPMAAPAASSSASNIASSDAPDAASARAEDAGSDAAAGSTPSPKPPALDAGS